MINYDSARAACRAAYRRRDASTHVEPIPELVDLERKGGRIIGAGLRQGGGPLVR